MEYKIIGFNGYLVTDDRQILKITQSPKGQKVSTISAMRPRGEEGYDYIRLSRNEDGTTKRYTFPLDEVFVSAKLGLTPGTPESRAQLKKYRHERELMGKVSEAVGDQMKEQEVVNLLHADLVRQMKQYGFIVDTDNLLVFSVSQMLFDFLRACSESAKTPLFYEVVTKNGKTIQEHPLGSIKRKYFDRVLTGLRALGLTYEKVVKELPQDVLDHFGGGNMFEEKEREESRAKLGITWNE